MTTHHRIITTAAVALTLGTGAAPASALINRIGSDSPGQPASVPPTIVRVVPANNGFDWADAGIGAVGGLALSMVALGGGLAVSQRRSRRGESATA